MNKEDFINVINGLDIKTIEGFYLKIKNSDDVRGYIEQGLDCINLEERVHEAIEYIEENEFKASDGEICYFCNMQVIKDLLDILRGDE